MSSKKYSQKNNWQTENYRPEESNERRLYRQAKKRVKARIGFYWHLASFVMVNLMLITIYLLTTPGGYPWFIWPLFGWGIGLASHFMSVLSLFNNNQFSYQQMVEREMSKLGYNRYPVYSQTYASPTVSSWPTTSPAANESRPDNTFSY